MAFFWLIRPFNAIAVELTSRNVTDPHMPDVTGPMADWIQVNHPGGGAVIRVLIELESHFGRVTAEQSKIDAISPRVRTPRHRAPCQNATPLGGRLDSVGFLLFANRLGHQLWSAVRESYSTGVALRAQYCDLKVGRGSVRFLCVALFTDARGQPKAKESPH